MMKTCSRSSLIACVVSLLCLPLAARAGDLSAFLEPAREIEVASSEMGTLAYLNIQEGAQVTAGQVLGGLDESVLQAALDVAQKTKEARGRLHSAEAELALQNDRLAKVTELVERRHASQEELARAHSQQQIAQSQVQNMHEEMAIKIAEYGRIEAQLLQKRIQSPIDGIVTHIYKDVGEFISASDPIVVKVVNLDSLLVEYPVPAAAATQFSVGQTIHLTVGNDRRKTPAVIEFISPLTDAQSNTIRIKLRIANVQGEYQSGQPCWLTLPDSSPSGSTPAGYLTRTRP